MSFIAIWSFLKDSWVGKLVGILLMVGAAFGLKAIYDSRKREEGRAEVKAKVKVEAEKAQVKMEKARETYPGAETSLEQGKF